jgi:hypothetical protein
MKINKLKIYFALLVVGVLSISCEENDSFEYTRAVVSGITADNTDELENGGSTTLRVTATDPAGGTLNYYWYKVVGQSGSQISGANSPEYSTPALFTDTSYYAVVTNGSSSAQSESILINVDDSPTVNISSEGDVTKIISGTTIEISATAEDDETSNELITYQWYISIEDPEVAEDEDPVDPLGNDVLIDGATDLLFTTPALTEATSYIVIVNDGENSTTSNIFTVKINAIPEVTIAAEFNSVDYGTSTTITATATDADSDSLTYTWYIDADVDVKIENATSAVLETSQLLSETSYYVIINDGTESITSDRVTVSIN